MDQRPEDVLFFAGGDRKRRASDLILEDLLNEPIVTEMAGGENRIDKDEKTVEIRTHRARVFATTGAPFAVEDDDESFDDFCAADICLPFRNREMANGFSNCGLMDTLQWSHKLNPKHSSISAAIDSPSSICAGSPTSATKQEGRDNQAMGANSSSSREQSDDDDIGTEGGACDLGVDPIEIKRIRRILSNRLSARRSRKRKQAEKQELEQQVEKLRGENESLFKQLSDATQQFKDAATNNRVLKSDVEALRAKVKLAEDMVARGSLTPNLGHLLQNHVNVPESCGIHNMCRVGNVSPTMNVRGDDAWQNSTPRLENADTFNGNGIISDTVSCVSEIWPWESHVPTISK